MKRLKYFLLPLQIIVLLLSPRFGWNIHALGVGALEYKGMAYENGAFHCVYQSDADTVDIRYPHPFSKRFTITVNDTDEYSLAVKIDGESVESDPDMLPGIANDIVWQDTYGILYWRCILTVAMTLLSMRMFRRAKGSPHQTVLCAAGSVLYALSMLISLRIIL